MATNIDFPPSGSALHGGVFAACSPGNVVIIDGADPVEQPSARALSLVSIAHPRGSQF